MNKMSISYLQLLATVVILAGVVFYGSGKKEESGKYPSGTSGQSPLISKNTAQEQSPDQHNPQIKTEKEVHQQHSLIKPGAAISLKNTEPFYAEAPGVYEYQLQLVSPSRTGKMTVEVSASEGVGIVSSMRHFEFELREGGEYAIPLTLDVSSQGRFYIQLHVSVSANEKPSTRVIAAILQVGTPAVKAQKAAARSSADEANSVISLPAQETISPR